MIVTRFVSFLLLIFVSASVALAVTDTPDPKTVLTLEIPATSNQPEQVLKLTMDDLHALPHTLVETSTIWTQGEQRFVGVRLEDLLRAHDIQGADLTLYAANDYHILVPKHEPALADAVIAYERNGAPMIRRDKGPLWMIFDYDSDPALRTETIYTLSVWQLDRIVVSR